MSNPNNNLTKYLTLWLSWLLASASGGTLLGALSAPNEFFWYLIMTGFVVGVAQWLVLRRYLPYAGWWILASGLGWFLGIMVSITTGEITAPIIELLASASGFWRVFWLDVVHDTVVGAGLGVGQWLVLRRHTQRAGWWVIASPIGRVVGGEVARACSSQIPGLCDGVSWASYAAVTGMALVWLLPNITEMGRDR